MNLEPEGEDYDGAGNIRALNITTGNVWLCGMGEFTSRTTHSGEGFNVSGVVGGKFLAAKRIGNV